MNDTELRQFIIDRIELYGLTPSEADTTDMKCTIARLAVMRFGEVFNFQRIYMEVVEEMRRVNAELGIGE